MNVVKTGQTRVSDVVEILPTKYIMPKISSNNCIVAAFEEISEALNNSKLWEAFLNGNKEDEIVTEIMEIFERNR